jgi:XTP/dITP diphosphohydrolase
MDELREKCPWDRKQTFESLITNTVEETYELVDALSGGDMQEIKKELGDLLLQVVFYAKIGNEQGAFDFGDVANAISDKLVFRHPHVFGDVTAENAEQVLHNWEELKQRERKMQQLKNRSVMSGVPRSLPPLVKAFRIQEKASAVGFDWAAADDVWEKVKEEICEFETEVKNNDKDKMQAEFGDLLFAMVNAARLYGLSPEAALEATNRKFLERFDHIEQTAQQEGVEVKDLGIDRMEELWQQAKKIKH